MYGFITHIIILLLQLTNTCSGCTPNCSMSANKGALLISAMEDCTNPLHSIVFVITEHSEDLYKTILKLKSLSTHQPASDDDNISFNDVDDHCWCQGTD